MPGWPAPVRGGRAALGWLGLSEAKPQGAMNHLWGRPPAADSTTATQMRAELGAVVLAEGENHA